MLTKFTTMSDKQVQNQCLSFIEVLRNSSIDDETFSLVLCKKRYTSLLEFIHAMCVEKAPWFSQNINEFTVTEVVKLSEVFWFKSNTRKGRTKEIFQFCVDHPEFRYNDFESLYTAFSEALNHFVALNPDAGYQFLNMMPPYGGHLQDPKAKMPEPNVYPGPGVQLDFDGFDARQEIDNE